MNHQERYLSFLLRLWRESAGAPPGGNRSRGDPPLWRASLERPQSDERLGFASLADLFAFLEEETGTSPVGLGKKEGPSPEAPKESTK